MTTNSATHRQKEDIKERWGVAEQKGAGGEGYERGKPIGEEKK